MNPNDIIARLISALEHAEIPYMIVGSYSSNLYGIHRATQDVDFEIELRDKSFTPIIQNMLPDVIFDPQVILETVTGTLRYVGVHNPSRFKIEVFMVGDDAYQRERFVRRVQMRFLDRLAWYPTVEDVIVQKLRWYSRARRSKDYDDARDVLSVQAKCLDLDYIRRWCDVHCSREIFEKLYELTRQFETDL